MGLSEVVGRLAVRRPHVLLLGLPGGLAARLAVQEVLDARGWVRATSPADADLLVVAGPAEAGDALGDGLARTWSQVPGPRARVDVRTPGEAADRLDEGRRALADAAHQRGDATGRDVDEAAHDLDEDQAGDMAPAGLPLAGGAEDRDGLEMDVLHLPLGPLGPDWPAGLVVATVLHGDLVTAAEVSWDPAAEDHPVAATAAARDAVSSALRLVGGERRARLLRADAPGATARLRRDLDRRRSLLALALGPAAAGVRRLLAHLADPAAAPLEPLDGDALAALLTDRDLGEVVLLCVVLAPRLVRTEAARA